MNYSSSSDYIHPVFVRQLTTEIDCTRLAPNKVHLEILKRNGNMLSKESIRCSFMIIIFISIIISKDIITKTKVLE